MTTKTTASRSFERSRRTVCSLRRWDRIVMIGDRDTMGRRFLQKGIVMIVVFSISFNRFVFLGFWCYPIRSCFKVSILKMVCFLAVVDDSLHQISCIVFACFLKTFSGFRLLLASSNIFVLRNNFRVLE